MRSRKRLVFVGLIVLVALCSSLGWVLFKPLSAALTPASFHCYDAQQGRFVPFARPPQVFGVGLSYAGHINETAAHFSPGQPAPLFRKHLRSLTSHDAKVRLPSTQSLFAAADSLERGLGKVLRGKFPQMNALLDYEVELGFVLLETIDPKRLQEPDFVPRLGFFIANDLSARSVALLGEGRPNKVAYWGVSKSFSGFLPVGARIWIPHQHRANGIPCVQLETRVNGVRRQHQNARNMIYTPRQMLRFVHARFPKVPLSKGTAILTGTPAGVAIQTPRWLVRAANLLRLGRLRKLSIKRKAHKAFLKPGDTVTVSGEFLGKIRTHIVR